MIQLLYIVVGFQTVRPSDRPRRSPQIFSSHNTNDNSTKKSHWHLKSRFKHTFTKALDYHQHNIMMYGRKNDSNSQLSVAADNAAIGINYETHDKSVDICISRRTLTPYKNDTVRNKTVLLEKSFCVSSNTLPTNSSHCQIHVCGTTSRYDFLLSIFSILCIYINSFPIKNTPLKIKGQSFSLYFIRVTQRPRCFV